jgi:hypothetical protein
VGILIILKVNLERRAEEGECEARGGRSSDISHWWDDERREEEWRSG